MSNEKRSRDDKHEAVFAKPLEVTARKGETVERMIKRFTKKVRNEGVLQDFTHRRYFEKPSVIRRRKKNRAKWVKANVDREQRQEKK